MCERQAGAEIEVTPEMRERLMEVFYEWRADNHDGVVEFCGPIDIESFVVSIRRLGVF